MPSEARPSRSCSASAKRRRASSKKPARAKGGRAWAGQCEVGDEDAVGAFFEQAAAALGPIDILVNNAGITRDAHVIFHDRARWQEVLSVNLDAAYYCVRAVVRGMLLRRWGRIINVSSASARVPLAGQASYAASKAGLEGLTRALSRDLAAKGVLVNAVSPGLIETDMLETMTNRREPSISKASPSGASASRAKWRRSSRFLHPMPPATSPGR